FSRDAGSESALGNLDFVLGLIFEDLFEDLDDVLLVIDDHDAGAAGEQVVQRHAMQLHESDELVERDPPVFAARDAIPVQGARVEPFADGPWRDIADLGYLTGGENVFHFRGT